MNEDVVSSKSLVFEFWQSVLALIGVFKLFVDSVDVGRTSSLDTADEGESISAEEGSTSSFGSGDCKGLCGGDGDCGGECIGDCIGDCSDNCAGDIRGDFVGAGESAGDEVTCSSLAVSNATDGEGVFGSGVCGGVCGGDMVGAVATVSTPEEGFDRTGEEGGTEERSRSSWESKTPSSTYKVRPSSGVVKVRF